MAVIDVRISSGAEARALSSAEPRSASDEAYPIESISLCPVSPALVTSTGGIAIIPVLNATAHNPTKTLISPVRSASMASIPVAYPVYSTDIESSQRAAPYPDTAPTSIPDSESTSSVVPSAVAMTIGRVVCGSVNDMYPRISSVGSIVIATSAIPSRIASLGLTGAPGSPSAATSTGTKSAGSMASINSMYAPDTPPKLTALS